MQARTLPEQEGLELAQGHLCNFSFGNHVHLDYHVGIVTQGVQLFRTRTELNRLVPGRVALVNPDEVHDGFAEGEQGYSLKVLKLEPQRVEDIVETLSDKAALQWFSHAIIDDPRLYQQLAYLHASSDIADKQPLAWQTQWLDTMAWLFSRYTELKSPEVDKGLDRLQLAYLRDYLMADLADKHSLDDLAALFSLSSYQFLRRFRASMGITPHAYLLSLRLDYACRLLRRGGRVGDVANACGFYDQSHFVHAFRKANGVVPSQYRMAN